MIQPIMDIGSLRLLIFKVALLVLVPQCRFFYKAPSAYFFKRNATTKGQHSASQTKAR